MAVSIPVNRDMSREERRRIAVLTGEVELRPGKPIAMSRWKHTMKDAASRYYRKYGRA